jgi:hypothetical protein
VDGLNLLSGEKVEGFVEHSAKNNINRDNDLIILIVYEVF